MTRLRRELVSLIEQGAIPPDQVAQAVSASGLYPSPRSWGVFFDRLLLWLGALALACAVLFFIAYNWVEMGRWLRFGLVQVALVSAVAIGIWGKASPLLARVALTSASLLVGVLLALFGQVYQTGADPWQLFSVWAIFILPWVWVARFDVLWLAWLALLNLTLWLYFRTWGGVLGVMFTSGPAVLWGLFLLNTTALVVWELGVWHQRWGGRWAVRLLVLGSGIPITLIMLILVSASHFAFAPVVMVYPLWLAALYGVYRYWRPDLFMLAGGCVSLITVITLLLARFLLWEGDWQAGNLLLLAIAVLALGAGAVVWLKRLHEEGVQ
ncbi:DUF2157 domain-containing protein [Vreelandella olivaria]|uniref:DUF2157 domain-containing protein n=1 Tax=Vreelandella olivaria TaxID=390919 RepID=UPI00201ED9D1|nr:DUF2157 domain-containing protein [Halomonas olivaria]